MVTLEEIEFGSEEYKNEVERENAYYLCEMLCAVYNGMYLPTKIEKSIKKLIEEIEKEVGEKEFTVSISYGKE